MATITLKYQKNQSQEIRIEKLKISSNNGEWLVEDEKTPSFFLEEYKEAIGILNGILSLSSNGNNKKTNNGKEDDKKQAEKSINNRILFVGQRGTGKTSAMKSFAEGLNDAENNGEKAFTCLPMIDPSNFDNNTNILLTVITMMFSEAKHLMNKKNDDEDVISQRENLLKRFDEVFKSLKAILGNDKPSFNLEGLNEKSLALKMHTGMHDLVKGYLNFYNTVNDTRVNRLVLLIDDIDMTVSHAPEMLEQLRKYLDIENVIILMSANLSQLYNEMREHYSQAFKETLKDRNQALFIDVEDLANKYLLKLFPTSRRVRVEHSVKQLIEADLEVENNKTASYTTKLADVEGTIIGRYESDNSRFYGRLDSNVVVECKQNKENRNSNNKKGRLQNVILSLIWEKTRLLFIPKDPDNVLHPIIPTNLRELMQFLDMLTSLKEVKYTDKKLFEDSYDYDNCKDNVAKFKKYFLHNWIPSHLPVEEELVFDNIPTDITEINKHLINSINVIGTKHKDELMSRQVSLDMIERNAEDVIKIDRDIYTMVSLNDPKFVKANKISDIFNQPSNYSYGDLLLMIDKYETYFESGDNRKFTDAIKIYYSILLFETMFFGSKEVEYYKAKVENKNLDEMLIPIQQLIGGTVYYPNYFEIIEDKYFNQKGPSFDAKRAFYHKLPVEKKDNKKVVGDGYPFFAVLYYGDIRPDRYDTKHIYDTTFENDANIDGNDFVTFDILSILSNILNPWHTYFRAREEHLKESDNWKIKIEGNPEVSDQSEKEGWRDFCEIKRTNRDEGSVYIPNSILPFYSVDMMLNYLKHSLRTKDVLGKTYDDISKIIEIIIKKGREEYNKFLKLTRLEDNIGGENGTESLETPSTGKTEQVGKITVDSFIASIKSAEELKAINDLDNIIKLDDNPKKLLESVIAIIYDIHKCYINLVGCPPKYGVRELPEPFRNHVIAILLSNYKGTKKDLNTLIKELDKYSSVSEIYRHVVDVLWNSTINEILIHRIIQEKVHGNDAVGEYYNKLWAETAVQLKEIVPPVEQNRWDKKELSRDFFEKMVNNQNGKTEQHKIEDVKSILLYLNLFKKAKEVFIDIKKQ